MRTISMAMHVTAPRCSMHLASLKFSGSAGDIKQITSVLGLTAKGAHQGVGTA
jgi:hypothetical protein